ncbi:UNVERIFIED_CONTAM: ABC-2 type transport system ATP-binding protein [Acetivibrio alkalicellulosi]
MIYFKTVMKTYKKNSMRIYFNLEIKPGEVVGIIGENGSGKSTLMKIGANLINYDKGCVFIDGEPFTEKAYEKLSFISEQGSYFPFLTSKDHEEFFQVNFENFDKSLYNKLLDYFDIPKNKKISTFSKGQKAKFEVVCGYSKKAKYILMDEPFLGTDVRTRSDFLKLMIGSMNNDDIIVIATHFTDEIENFLTRAILMKDGDIIKDIDIEKLREDGGTLVEELKKASDYKEDILDIIEN